ncbi:hypothetical protein IV203_007131 [Nitzschia inconspicua]|uniref:Uncharacterized protein n=1 Tax=Nitzschia inconspicua TaxID=303405 RepID=A0A9K3KEW9_9STRA|nr:hypothetical protein IV203_007131 [Nitzschia inconspicua]
MSQKSRSRPNHQHLDRHRRYYERSCYRPSRRSTGRGSPRCTSSSWRLWRHCCCRYGWYPILVAPFITFGCILSLYSSGRCDFIRVDVGFTPANEAWNDSTAELGLFFYQTGENHTNRYRATFLNGCRQYTDEFVDEFIRNDRTWNVSRIMAYVAGGGGILSTIIAWLFVFTPLPAFFIWSAILLPALMAAFLAEGSKFLFFDTAVCRSSVWSPPGTDSLARVAENCSLGDGGKYALASGIIFFLALIPVCLKAPEMRDFEPNYGLDFENQDHEETSDDINDDTFSDQDGCRVTRDHEAGAGDDSDFSITTTGHDSVLAGMELGISKSDCEEDDLIVHRFGTLDDEKSQTTRKKQNVESQDGENTDSNIMYNANKPTLPTCSVESTTLPLISESRLTTAQKLAMNLAPSGSKQDLIDKFVSEFNASFEKELQ